MHSSNRRHQWRRPGRCCHALAAEFERTHATGIVEDGCDQSKKKVSNPPETNDGASRINQDFTPRFRSDWAFHGSCAAGAARALLRGHAAALQRECTGGLASKCAWNEQFVPAAETDRRRYP